MLAYPESDFGVSADSADRDDMADPQNDKTCLESRQKGMLAFRI
jgi:hypothetical protein